MRLLLLLPLLWCVAAQAQDNWRQALMDMAPSCRIRMSVPTDAQVGFSRENRGSGSIRIAKPPRATEFLYEFPLMLNFTCFSASENLTSQRPVRFDAVQKKWVRDTRDFFTAFGEGLTPEGRKNYDEAIRFYELQAVNAQGFAYTQDDVIGDERGRRRQLFYCLFHAQKAICGEETMALISMTRQNPKNDLTPYALRILRSIEFLD